MPKKRVPIFERAMNLLKVSFFMSKMKKPIALKLILLKKTRVLKKLKNHNYGFIREYEFSPSNSTPLVHYNRKLFKKRSNRSEDIYSRLFLCRCSSKLRMEWEREDYDDDDDWALETPPIMDDIVIRDVKTHELSGLDEGEEEEEEEEEEEDDSIDRKAEMFIQRFYEEMKMQSQESLLQYK